MHNPQHYYYSPLNLNFLVEEHPDSETAMRA
jgi:hypothetical protein